MQQHLLKYLFVLAAVLMLGACGVENSPQGVAMAFSKAVMAGDADTAIGLVDFSAIPDDRQDGAKKSMKTALKIMHTKTEAWGGVDSIEVTKVDKTDDSHARVSITTHFNDGEPRVSGGKVIRVDDQWRIVL